MSSSRFENEDTKNANIKFDRQARNKDPMTGLPSREAQSLSDPDDRRARRVEHKWDSYEARERRRWAATVLDNSDMLSRWAQKNNTSIPQTKYFFTKIMCGMEDFP